MLPVMWKYKTYGVYAACHVKIYKSACLLEHKWIVWDTWVAKVVEDILCDCWPFSGVPVEATRESPEGEDSGRACMAGAEKGAGAR